MIFNIFPYPKKVDFSRYLLKYFLNSLVPTKAFHFIVNPKDLSLSTYRDISLSLEG